MSVLRGSPSEGATGTYMHVCNPGGAGHAGECTYRRLQCTGCRVHWARMVRGSASSAAHDARRLFARLFHHRVTRNKLPGRGLNKVIRAVEDRGSISSRVPRGRVLL
ncbi:hypothetical protein NDU88_000343 [Pleurodeles waltl]|uniref:Uncharacterized protein n=1 Tax=Pleurodeles waltl TaxID=8319 RepID=A0AAV7SWB6_PLEWA|nr:hypothetical protein NDU88_000343 [Pleurodeles waltl]